MIRSKLLGRLGNQMFQYAILRVVCKKLNYNFHFQENWLGKDIFDIDYGVDVKKDVNNYINFDEGLNKYNPSVFDITDNTIINGFWQSEKYFDAEEDFIRTLFPFKQEVKDKCDKIENLLDENVCLIHFRGGDYKYHNYIPSFEWYEKAKNEMKIINENITFKIITDDVYLAKQYFPNDEIYSNTMIEDFYILMKSKLKIISASTFSWWSAWLSINDDKVIIAPNKWLNHNNQNKKTNGFYPFDIQTKKFIYI